MLTGAPKLALSCLLTVSSTSSVQWESSQSRVPGVRWALGAIAADLWPGRRARPPRPAVPLLPRQLGFLRNALIASSAINDPRGQNAPGRVLLPGPQGCCSRSAPGNTAPSSCTAEPRPRPPHPRPPIPLPRDGVHAGGWWCRPRAALAPCPWPCLSVRSEPGPLRPGGLVQLWHTAWTDLACTDGESRNEIIPK